MLFPATGYLYAIWQERNFVATEIVNFRIHSALMIDGDEAPALARRIHRNGRETASKKARNMFRGVFAVF